MSDGFGLRRVAYLLGISVLSFGFVSALHAAEPPENAKTRELGALAWKLDTRLIPLVDAIADGRLSGVAAAGGLKSAENRGLAAAPADRLALELNVPNVNAQALQDIEAAGAAVIHSAARWNTISVEASPEVIATLANLAGIKHIKLARAPKLRRAGLADNQADISMKADQVRATFGLTGAGQKVGVVSDSCRDTSIGPGSTAGTTPNAVLSGLKPQLSGDMPSTIQVVSFGSGGGTDEGSAMMELIHDIAPNAALAFGSSSTGQTAYATNLGNLRTVAGCTVTVDDVFFLDEPFFQDGPIAQAITTNATNGVPHFSAVGNDADQGILMTYKSVTNSAADDAANPPTGKDFHDWGIGGATPAFLPLVMPAGASMQVVLQWNEPYESFGLGTGSHADLDMYLAAAPTLASVNAPLTSSSDPQGTASTPNNDPFESISYTNSGASTQTVYLVVNHFHGSRGNVIRIVFYTGSSITFPAAVVNAMTAGGHSASADGINVGAIFYGDIDSGGKFDPDFSAINAETFSSKGGIGAAGVPYYFSTTGAALPGAPVLRDVPDIAAPDGTNTTFFGSPDINVTVAGTNYDPDSFLNFFGTSAAAPNAAAVAALIKQRTGTMSPAQLKSLLKSTARDIVASDPPSAAGPDARTGAGLIDALAAINAAPGVLTHPANVSVASGQNASFTITAAGSPTLTFQWQKITAGSFQDVAGATAATLNLTSVTAADVNRYHCKVSNAFGTATSRDAILRVDAGPITWIGPAAGGSWNTASNWNPARVPTIADDVVFPNTMAAATVSLGANQSCFSLTLNSAAASSLSITGGSFGLSVGGTSLISSGPTATISAAINLLSGSAVTVNTAGGLTISGIVSGPAALTKTGAGTLTLSGANTFSGSPLAVNSGILSVASNTNLGAAVNSISLGAATLQATASFSLNRAIALTGAGIISVNSGVTLTATEPVSGANALTKSGTGTLVFSAANTYTGATTLSQGTLLVNGSIATSSSVSVAAGTTLGGRGTVGAMSVAGTVSPGDPATAGGVGKLTATGNVSFTNTSTLTIQIPSTAANAFDVLDGAAGTLTIQSGAILRLDLAGLSASTAAQIGIEKYLNGSGAAFTVNVVNNTNNVSPVIVSYKNTAPKQVQVALGAVAVTPVRLADFSAHAEGAGTLVQWTAVSEYKNAGFNVWRREHGVGDQSWQKINRALIAGRLTSTDEKGYIVFDWPAPGAYEYALESVGLTGEREMYGETSGTVSVDLLPGSLQALSIAEMESAQRSAERLQAASRVAELNGRVLRATEKSFHAIPSAWLQRDGSREILEVTAAARELDGGKSAAAPIREAAFVSASVVPRWFGASPSALRARGKAVKAVHSGSGVLWIPRSALPGGYGLNRLNILREGRAVTALALTSEGMALYAPGYSDEYTDKDAFFLTRSAKATLAGAPVSAAGLFGKDVSASTKTTATARLDFHDIYFDFSQRPYNYPPWFSNQYLTEGSAQSFTLNLPDADGSSGTLRVNLWSVALPDSNAHSLQAFVNGSFAGESTWTQAGQALEFEFKVAGGIFHAGDNSIELLTPELPGNPPQLSFANSIVAQYERELRGTQAVEIHAAVPGQVFEINGLPTAGAWVVDARFPDRAQLAPSETQSRADGSVSLRFAALGGGTVKYCVVPRGQEIRASAIEERTLQPLPSGVKWLGVGPSQFAPALAPLLRQRSKEGLKAAFVDQEQIFDYYGFGRYGPQPIQNAVRATRPAYLLLAGRTTYDYRNYNGAGVDPLCPTFLASTTSWSQTSADALFGDLGRGYPEISVGRLPANTPEEMAGAVQHTLGHAGAPGSSLRALIAADIYDPETADFAALGDTVSASLPEVLWTKSYLGMNAPDAGSVTEAMRQAANGDADAILYVGHGNSARLGATAPRILDVDRVELWTGNVVFLQATCTANWVAKDETGFRSIAIQGLVQPQGGLGASIGSSTYVHADSATQFIARVMSEAQAPGARWGDAVRRAQQWAWSEAGASASMSGIFLDLLRTEGILGDPALTVAQKPKQAAPAASEPGKF